MRRVSKWVALGALIIMGAWDLIPIFSPDSGDTISEVIAASGRKHPTLPFAFGVLCAHFFCAGKSIPIKQTAILLFFPWSIMVAADCVGLIKPIPMMLAVVLGGVAGGFLWAQDKKIPCGSK